MPMSVPNPAPVPAADFVARGNSNRVISRSGTVRGSLQPESWRRTLSFLTHVTAPMVGPHDRRLPAHAVSAGHVDLPAARTRAPGWRTDSWLTALASGVSARMVT